VFGYHPQHHLFWDLVAIVVYFFPTIVAVARRHRAMFAIFLLNIVLGITVIGWIGSLVWALTNPNPQPKAKSKPHHG
jgi:hypothetical protein